LTTEIIAAHATPFPTEFLTTEVGITTKECRGATFKALVIKLLHCKKRLQAITQITSYSI
jgi:hypothetical protein